jgi:hypothetical protein
MPKGDRANLEHLLRSAWERQTAMRKSPQGSEANALRPMRAKSAQRTKPNKPPRWMRRIVAYLRGAGIVSLLLAFAALMFLPDYFMGFVVLVYMAIALWGCDLFFEIYSSEGGRVLVAIAVLIILAGFTFGFVWVKAPIGFRVMDNSVDYPSGTVLGTTPPIPWLNEYDDLDVSIVNPTDHDYTDIDLTFKPDLPVAAISQVNGAPCSFSDPTGTTISLTDVPFPTGEVTGIPMVALATDVGERVRCERVLRQGGVEIIMAVASVEMRKPGSTLKNGYVLKMALENGTNHWFRRQDNPLDDSFWKPRVATSWVDVWGSYVVLQRRRYVSKKLDTMKIPIEQIKRQARIP